MNKNFLVFHLDLPGNLKSITFQPFFTLLTLGVTSSFYLVSGNQNRLPQYLKSEFNYSESDTRLVTGETLRRCQLLFDCEQRRLCLCT